MIRKPGEITKTPMNAVAKGRADGIGFMLLGADIGAGDLDQCRDPESGKIESWPKRYVTKPATPTKKSPLALPVCA